jgi:two-component system response regulator
MSEIGLILLVDDSGDDLAIALRALRRTNLPVEVRTARDGREALAVLHVDGRSSAREPLRPRVIFLDLRMPRADGFEVLRALRDAPHTRDIPVVVISTSASPADAQRAYELGANSYLVKRAEVGDPGGLIAQAARYWVELNYLPMAG